MMIALEVFGMVCEGCASAVKRAIAAADPAAAVTVERESGRVMAETSLSEADAIAAIEQAGYEARPLPPR